MKKLLENFKKSVYKKLPKIVYSYHCVRKRVSKYKLVPFDEFDLEEGCFCANYINIKDSENQVCVQFFVESIVDLEFFYNNHKVFKTKKEAIDNINDQEDN